MIRKLNSRCMPLLMAGALLYAAAGAHAHGLWIEPGQGGYKVFFGEPEHNLREKKDKLGRFASLKAWKADGSGTRLEIKEDHLFAAGAGGFSVANLDAPVREPREGKGASGGPVKSYQYLRFYDRLDGAGKPSAHLFLDLVPEGRGTFRFTVLKGGKPLPEARVEVLAPNGWGREFKADKEGKVEVQAPWPGLYILKTSWKDAAPGEFQGKKYEAANHGLTVSFVKN